MEYSVELHFLIFTVNSLYMLEVILPPTCSVVLIGGQSPRCIVNRLK